MSKCLIVMVCVSLLVSGCRTPPLEAIDGYVADVVSHPIDVAPTPAPKASRRPAGGGRCGAGRRAETPRRRAGH